MKMRKVSTIELVVLGLIAGLFVSIAMPLMFR